MGPSDDEFLQELQAAFQIEADEHLQVLSAGLLDLEKTPDAEQQTLLETVYREAHSLKGAARAVNRTEIETVCQSLETVLSSWRRHRIVPSADTFDTLHRALDVIGSLLSGPEGGATAPDRRLIAEVSQQLDRAAGPGSGVPPNSRDDHPPGEPSSPLRREAPAVPEKPILSETVRISTAKLDALLRQAEEMLLVKQTVGQRVADLRDAQALLERWERDWAKSQVELRPIRQAPDSDAARLLELLDGSREALKSLESRVSALTRSAQQDHREIGVQVDDLLENAKKLLMLPFSTLLGIFPKMVRDLARDEGKDVLLVIRGGEVEIDKRILEEIKDPLIHLLRNSVDHGVEPPGERERQGKPPRATVTLAVSQISGNEVEILVSDDGGGIDVARVKASAIRHGVVSEEAAGQMGEAEALALIFQSEVSTSPIITEISGRGLGMAIVREKAEKLGGRVGLETRLHEGTTFRIALPLTLATFKGILVQAAGQAFVIPTAEVEHVMRIRPDAIQTVENRRVLCLDGRLVPLARLDDILELRRLDRRGDPPELMPVVVVGTAQKRVALHVEAILNEQEVLVKTFGKPLLRVRHVSGATVLGSGKPVPILNVADLMTSAVKLAARAAITPAAAGQTDGGEASEKAILLVEDSITSRMLLKNILELAGYLVVTAVDGIEALTALRTQDFALVVSDVDMPRMNGLDLTARIRADRRLEEIPVVLVTARDSPEDRERGVDVGANAYLVKNNFDQNNLLATVRRLI